MSKKHKQSESNDDLSSLQAFNICPVFDRYKHNGYPDDGMSTFVDERERDP